MASFVPEHTGERFNPHVTTGVAPAAAYQLGPFGPAARRLSTLIQA